MKIKVFDAHTDILFDVYKASLKGDLTRFKDYHEPQLKGNIKGGIWTVYSPDEFDLYEALKTSKQLVDLKGYEVILGIEGLRNLHSLEDYQKIYDLGFRHSMLTWNESNKYATGISGDTNRGVTKEGYELLDFMINHDMIIDLSHLNEKSFYDVLNYTNKNILVSHSNLKRYCDHVRNLSDEQLLKLKEANALVGLTLAGAFIHKDEDKRTLDTFMLHLKDLINIMGIDNVCFGFDFMDYFNYSNRMPNIYELPNASHIGKLIDKLYENNYSTEEIEKLTYYNIYNRFKRHIFK